MFQNFLNDQNGQNIQNIQNMQRIEYFMPFKKKIPKWKQNSMVFREPEPFDAMPPKERFRVICEENIPYIRNIDLPVIKKNNPLEAVLIEYRIFPHMEFLIRNAMIKLGNKWSHTVVCGNLNYDFMVSMCANISPEITVIKTDYDNLNQSTYSVLLASKVFWEMFAGEKILLYQEDSCIFKSNVDDFLQWDYIGAPWAKTQNDTPNCVGNGGFSLRTKQTMIDVINRVSIYETTNISSNTSEYMRNTGMTVCPEDVYFSKNMQDYGIGRVADWDSAFTFSCENVYNGDSFGGHNFWLSDDKWKARVYNIYKFVTHHDFSDLNTINTLNNTYNCVCIASPYDYTIGGGEKYLSFLMKYFIKKGYKVIFFTVSDINTTVNTLQYYHNKNEISNITISNYPNIYEPNIYAIKFKYFVFMYNNSIPNVNIKISADKKIFHCQFPFDYEVARNSTEYYYLNNDEIHKVLNMYDYIIVNSEYTKESLISHYTTFNYFTQKIHVVYPPCIENINANVFSKTSNMFVMLGRIFDYSQNANNKYFDVAISVFNELCNYDYKLVIIGSVKSYAYYEKLINMINDKNKIIILPDISDEEKNKYLQMAKYYIQLTGINDKYAFNKEHFGISMVEALHNGCIPISVNAGYPKYLIQNNVNGYLVDSGERLKELVVNLLENRAPEINTAINTNKFTNMEFFKNMEHI